MTGTLIYKCRLCGDMYKPTSVPDVLTVMMNVVSGTPLPEEWYAGKNIDLLQWHSCSKSRIGLSDLVGVEE